MKEYIERAAVETMLENAQIITDGENCGYCTEDVDLNSIPAADVVEVRHGRWVKPVPGDGENYCSVCKAEQPWFYGYGYFESDYCPSCGARMEKEDEHETG